MVYIVFFNKKYGKQFEAVINREDWNEVVSKYGHAYAAALVITGCHKIKSKKNVTKEKQSSFGVFVFGSVERPDIFGAPLIKIGKSKKEILEKGIRGRSEFLVTSRPEIEFAPKIGFRRAGEVYAYQMGKEGKGRRVHYPR